MTGTVATAFSAAFRPSPPRGMMRSTTPSCVARCSRSSRPPATSAIAPSGIPADRPASIATAAKIAFECEAMDEPRNTIALPDLRHSAAASIVTFGRASYTTAITPSGTRTLRTSSPFASRKPSMTSPTGSGSATMSRTWPAIAAIRPVSSASRSISASVSPASRPASRSRALASRISGVRSISSSAIASSAASLIPEGRLASVRAARLAAAQVSATDVAVVAMRLKVTRAARSGRDGPPYASTK